MNKVLIVIKDGMINDVVSNIKLKLLVADQDIQGIPSEALINLDGKDVLCYEPDVRFSRSVNSYYDDYIKQIK